MAGTTIARWQDASGESIQHLALHQGEDEITADAMVIGKEEGAPFAAWFQIACDGMWRVRSVKAGLAGATRRIVLRADGEGHWQDGDGNSLSELDGAIDVDLPITPFTNTLPVRRLGLRAGESADLKVAYILLSEHRVIADPQRYVCIAPLHRYRYESLDSDFVREIEVDQEGLVVDYPGLFRRVQG